MKRVAAGLLAGGLTCLPCSSRAQPVQPVVQRLVLDSIVAPRVSHQLIRQLVAIDSLTAVILDDRTDQVTAIHAREFTVRSLGRVGDGRGEFRFANSIGRYRDSIAVYSEAGKKYVLLPLNGKRGTTVNVRVDSRDAPSGSDWKPLMLLREGSALVTLAYGPEPRHDTDARRLPVSVVPRERGSPRQITTLVSFGNRYVRAGSMARPNPFAGGDMLLTRSNGLGFLVLRQNPARPQDPAPLTIEHYDEYAARGRVVSLTLPPLPDGERALEAAMQRLRQSLGKNADTAEIRRQVGLAKAGPVVATAFLASDGMVWLRRFEARTDSTVWTQIDPMTARTVVVAFPNQCTPLDAAYGRLWLGCTEKNGTVVRRAWVR